MKVDLEVEYTPLPDIILSTKFSEKLTITII